MKASRAIFFICLCLSLISCNFFGGKENAGGEEPGYTAQIVWDSGLITNDSLSTTLDGDNVYFYERPQEPGYDEVNNYFLTKVDAKTGGLVWRGSVFQDDTGYQTFLFHDIIFCPPVVTDTYVYVFLLDNIICRFDKETGELNAVAEIDIENRGLEMEWNVTAYRRYLYFGLSRGTEYRYFVRLDVDMIENDPNLEKSQSLTPEILWELDKVYATAKPVVHNNIVYTSTFSIRGEEPVEIAGFDVDTGQMVFHTIFGGFEADGEENELLRDRGAYIGTCPILIHDDILYHLSWSISAWDIKTGELLYRHVFTDDIPNEKRYNANGIVQAAYYNGKIFYVTTASYFNYNGSRNTHCIDAATGKLVWNDIAEYSYSLEMYPIIAHGLLYVPESIGLRVYDAETGRLVGVDKSFFGSDANRNVLYGDYLICMRIDDYGDPKLVAVYVGK